MVRQVGNMEGKIKVFEVAHAAQKLNQSVRPEADMENTRYYYSPRAQKNMRIINGRPRQKVCFSLFVKVADNNLIVVAAKERGEVGTPLRVKRHSYL